MERLWRTQVRRNEDGFSFAGEKCALRFELTRMGASLAGAGTLMPGLAPGAGKRPGGTRPCDSLVPSREGGILVRAGGRVPREWSDSNAGAFHLGIRQTASRGRRFPVADRLRRQPG